MSPELIVTLIVGIASPVCTMLVTLLSTRSKMKAILKTSLRTTIQGIYAMYMQECVMPIAVYSGLCAMYDEYVELGGNSYIKGLKQEMDAWKKV